jgi:hypothetical protein
MHRITSFNAEYENPLALYDVVVDNDDVYCVPVEPMMPLKPTIANPVLSRICIRNTACESNREFVSPAPAELVPAWARALLLPIRNKQRSGICIYGV